MKYVSGVKVSTSYISVAKGSVAYLGTKRCGALWFGHSSLRNNSRNNVLVNILMRSYS